MFGLRSDGCSNVKTKYKQAVLLLRRKSLMLLQKDFHVRQLIMHIHIVPIYSVLNFLGGMKETICIVLNPKDLAFTHCPFSYLTYLYEKADQLAI